MPSSPGQWTDGVTLEASQIANNWNMDVNYGNSPEQQALSSVIASIRWSDSANATMTRIIAL